LTKFDIRLRNLVANVHQGTINRPQVQVSSPNSPANLGPSEEHDATPTIQGKVLRKEVGYVYRGAKSYVGHIPGSGRLAGSRHASAI
jgi:hypothetical protein